MDWVSVKDRLPEAMVFTSGQGWSKRVDVLLCDAKERMSVGYNRDGNLTMAKPIGIVTHWMHLPEPPK